MWREELLRRGPALIVVVVVVVIVVLGRGSGLPALERVHGAHVALVDTLLAGILITDDGCIRELCVAGGQAGRRQAVAAVVFIISNKRDLSAAHAVVVQHTRVGLCGVLVYKRGRESLCLVLPAKVDEARRAGRERLGGGGRGCGCGCGGGGWQGPRVCLGDGRVVRRRRGGGGPVGVEEVRRGQINGLSDGSEGLVKGVSDTVGRELPKDIAAVLVG